MIFLLHQAFSSSKDLFHQLMKNLRLKAARAALDMSQAELAKRVNVSRQTIVAIEKGDYNPTIKLCIAICHELGKTLDELFWEW